MEKQAQFVEELNTKYNTKGENIVLGKGMLDGNVVAEVDVKIPLKTINRHGLIAGATGTGKTKTIQVFVEQLSKAGVPSLVLDSKGIFPELQSQESKIPLSKKDTPKRDLVFNHKVFLSNSCLFPEEKE